MNNFLTNDVPLCVLGMHRSGTSLLANLLHKSGINMGDKMVGGGIGNVGGHYEDIDFHVFFEAAMKKRGISVGGLRQLPPISLTENEIQRLEKIFQNKTTSNNWGWKDPRTCLFVDYTHNLLPKTKYLVVIRSSNEVFQSLVNRAKKDTSFSLYSDKRYSDVIIKDYQESWFHYNKLIEKFLSKVDAENYFIVSHEELINQWASIKKWLSSFFGGISDVDIDEVFDASQISSNQVGFFNAKEEALYHKILNFSDDPILESQELVKPDSSANEKIINLIIRGGENYEIFCRKLLTLKYTNFRVFHYDSMPIELEIDDERFTVIKKAEALPIALAKSCLNGGGVFFCSGDASTSALNDLWENDSVFEEIGDLENLPQENEKFLRVADYTIKEYLINHFSEITDMIREGDEKTVINASILPNNITSNLNEDCGDINLNEIIKLCDDLIQENGNLIQENGKYINFLKAEREKVDALGHNIQNFENKCELLEELLKEEREKVDTLENRSL